MSNAEFDADVVIIGSGVMGGLIATGLARAGKSVIVLEAGPRVNRRDVVETFRNAPVKLSLANAKLQGAGSPYPSLPHAPSTYGDYLQQTGPVKYNTSYLRVVGGTTWHFGSSLWRMLPNDFRLKSLYGRGRDWPISYDELEPFYARAETELGVSGVDGQDESGQGGGAFPPRSIPYPMEGLKPSYMFTRLSEMLGKGGYNPILEPNGRATRPYGKRPPCAGNNNCNPVCPIAAKYDGSMHIDEAERHGAKVLENSVVYKIEAGDDGKITAIWYMRPDKSSHKLTARYFVLAAYGIESPKLLLMSTSEKYPNGIANSSDQVGRNLMDHTGMGLQFLADEQVWPGRGAVQQGGIFNRRDGEHRREYSAVKHALANNAPNAAVAARLIKQGVVGPELDERIRDESSRWVDVSTVFEMLPHASNRVQPHPTRRDALGIPTLTVHYDVDDYVKAARPYAEGDFNTFVKAMNGTQADISPGWQNRDHIMGTVLMGSDPRDSVVDADCRTHDHDNLFLATTGVIPASGVINPTLTGVALALRIADTIVREA
jgi:choline dehydrogenase-like flavoprotein